MERLPTELAIAQQVRDFVGLKLAQIAVVIGVPRRRHAENVSQPSTDILRSSLRRTWWGTFKAVSTQ